MPTEYVDYKPVDQQMTRQITRKISMSGIRVSHGSGNPEEHQGMRWIKPLPGGKYGQRKTAEVKEFSLNLILAPADSFASWLGRNACLSVVLVSALEVQRSQ